jgi:hypothetical protein
MRSRRRCLYCGAAPEGGWKTVCPGCEERRAAAGSRQTGECKAPLDCPDREARISRYEAMREVGLRLFEPTPPPTPKLRGKRKRKPGKGRG